MPGVMVVQGRELSAEDIGLIQGLLAEHRDWGRSRLSAELCRRCDWRNARGRIKDMAARTLLLKLERAGHIRLPKRRRKSSNGFRTRHAPLVAHATAPIRDALRDLRPLAVTIVAPDSEDLRLFNCLLSCYHYLGHRNTVGENLRYLVRDRAGRLVGCALFGSAAWKCAARDAWIGWDRARREANLVLLTNNTRLLVLPWVEVPHLASHMLACLARRIRADWQSKYGHPIHALETFVDRSRFRGVCYQRINETFNRARDKAGLQWLQLKDFRRAVAIASAESGQPLHVAQTQLGHSSIRTTEKYYAHFSPEFAISRAREVLENRGRQMGGNEPEPEEPETSMTQPKSNVVDFQVFRKG